MFILPFIASAHETKRAGSLDILLHMEPLDNPAAGEDAYLYFSVSDLREQFNFRDCDCRVTVKDSKGKELLNRALTLEDEAPDWGVNVSRVGFVFPHIGIYKVAIAGAPKTNTFDAFALEYDKRIERQNESDSLEKNGPAEETVWYKNYYVIGGAILIFGIIINEVFSKLTNKK